MAFLGIMGLFGGIKNNMREFLRSEGSNLRLRMLWEMESCLSQEDEHETNKKLKQTEIDKEPFKKSLSLFLSLSLSLSLYIYIYIYIYIYMMYII